MLVETSIERQIEYIVSSPKRNSISISQLLDAGRYDHVNPDISDLNFPVVCTQGDRVVVDLVWFQRPITAQETIRELNAQELRPATAAEVLAFGAQYPEVQEEFRVVELGQEWQRRVVFLEGRDRKRMVSLAWVGGVWDSDYRFAAVRRSA